MEASKSPAILPRVLKGIEAGVVGGLAMLALLAAAALLRGHVWWETPNLLGSTFYGTRAFRAGPGRITIAGGAFHLVITGVVGALFGVACGHLYLRRRLVLLGTLAGIVWYYLADAVFWKLVNPLVPLYSPPLSTLLSHALFGACLGYMGGGEGLPSESPVPAPSDPVTAGPLEADAGRDAVE
jgi:hypothetical protein